MHTVDVDGACIFVIGDVLESRDATQLQEGEHRRPVVRGLITQKDRDLSASTRRDFLTATATQGTRRPPKELTEGFVETANAAKARGHGDFRHREVSLMD